ncbi:MAG: hypothetical protein A3F17_00075 [Gammaproteobacteria bacterium RIFCSPHIGHO2_12_FULL_41_15]|nr:MAG: hypothetical protein A3F17_00075 [Gammaproteobacteria bacterium RIFCSPHIGHO2_12_FULL_41_15]
MKLYFSPGACCMSCHIILEETKTTFELVYVGKNADEKTRTQFLAINPLGAVPALAISEQKILTQNIAILEYLADNNLEHHLLDKAGTFERAEQMRWLSFIASDLHKAFSPLFKLTQISANHDCQESIRKWSLTNIEKYLSLVEKQLTNQSYLVSGRFTVADAYLFTVLRWTKAINFSMEKYTAIQQYLINLAKRPSIIAVLQREEKFK